MNKILNRISLFFLIALLSMPIIIKERDLNVFPFKCSSFSIYNLNFETNEKIKFNVTQDLRLQTENEGYLLFSGNVSYKETSFLLDRKLILKNGERVDDNTFKYRVTGMHLSPIDNTPTEIFNTLAREFSLINNNIQMDVVKVDRAVYMIGSPVSFLFTCVSY